MYLFKNMFFITWMTINPFFLLFEMLVIITHPIEKKCFTYLEIFQQKYYNENSAILMIIFFFKSHK